MVRFASRVPRPPSGTPWLAATPRLVVPIARYPAATKASAEDTSQAFGRSRGRGSLCRSPNAVMTTFNCTGVSTRGDASPGPEVVTRLARMSDEPNADTLAKTASSAYDAALEVIATVEPRIAEATRKELADQRASLKLIASENYASPAVLLTMGTWFSDKYAEGTVGHRFYAGCQNVDTVESIAAEHARELFGAPYAYVQPHSGIDANLVAFWSILAHHVETPTLERLGAKNVNELS